MAEVSEKTTDYLRWNAVSLKEYLVEKLTESEIFTDQIFEDSNLSVIIDLFAWLYDTLTYYLNHTGTESNFSDAQLYENLSRIVKMLRYNPNGFITSSAQFTMSLKLNQDGTSKSLEGASGGTNRWIIPKYTVLETNLTDANGKPVKYAFTGDYTFLSTNPQAIDTDFKPLLYNGTWVFYDNIFVSTEIPFETFTLTNLDLTSNNKIYLAHPYLSVYVQDLAGNFTEYTATTNIYEHGAEDDKDGRVFEVRLNEDKQYTLKFGDGINGVKLPADYKIFVIYLESNGLDGQIGLDNIPDDTNLKVQIDGLKTSFVEENFLDPNVSYISTDNLENLSLTNEQPSTLVKDFETVDEIRENAPNWFRMQGRLTTHTDFEQYIKANYSMIYDIQVQNNWDYMSEFLQWLYQYGKLNNDIRYYNYTYADSCDFNNVYIWLKSHDEELVPVASDLKWTIDQDIRGIKALTCEPVFVDPMMVAFLPYVRNNDETINWTFIQTLRTDIKHYIEITRNRNSMVTVERIKKRVIDTIEDFFEVHNNTLGQKVNIESLYTQLTTIDGVKEIKTKYLPNPSIPGDVTYFDGLSFAAWTPLLLQGTDFNVVNGVYELKSFQFPFLFDKDNLEKRITFVSEEYRISNVEY